MKKNILPLILFIVSLTACESDNSDPCIKGKVAFYDNCHNTLVIEVLSGSLQGDSVNLHSFKGANMVQFPISVDDDFFRVSSDSAFYFNYRFFDPEKNEYSVDDHICLPGTFPLDLPTIVITNYSTTNCPLNNEN